jgi:hypothetical protein
MRHTPVCNLNEELAFDSEAPFIDLVSTTSSILNLPGTYTLLSPHAAPCRRATQDEAMRSDDVFKAAAFAGMANALSPAPVALQYSDWCVLFPYSKRLSLHTVKETYFSGRVHFLFRGKKNTDFSWAGLAMMETGLLCSF